MHGANLRRHRLNRMIGLARVYRGWNSNELRDALGRDAGRLASGSGNPKLDLVARVADALEWDIGEVAESIWDASDETPLEVNDHESFASLDAQAQRLHRESSYPEMEAVGKAMRRIARNGTERAVAANRLAGAYDGMGRFPRVLQCVREGLAERGVRDEIRLMLSVNLAGAYYALWNLHEARAIATSVIESLAARAGNTRMQRVAYAFAHGLRGQCARRLLSECDSPQMCTQLAREAESDLECASQRYAELADQYGDAQYAGLAHTSEGALLEVRAASGAILPIDAIASIVQRLDSAIDLDKAPCADLLESCGWWSVFGANIALRAGERTVIHVSERSELERALAICTNKAAEIAEHLDLWPLRERAFTLEWFRRQQSAGELPVECNAWVLDADDVRVLVGTMGRFPLFRATGWEILDQAMLTVD